MSRFKELPHGNTGIINTSMQS